MLVPTLPEARYLILDDADLASLVCVAMATERWSGRGPAPVLAASWWRPDADLAMPLVHKGVERHAGIYGHERLGEELVIEPRDPDGPCPELSDLLLAASRAATRAGCDAVLFPVRAADLRLDRTVAIETVAREVDRAALVGRLAALDREDGSSCPVVTPLVDFDDEQLIDLARDLAVPVESCWWSLVRGDALASRAAERWSPVGAMPAGPAPGRELTRTA